MALFFPVASFFILVSPAVLAASNSASASVVVPANYCGITTNATNNTPHTATINAGTYQANIGTTTFKIVCGDKGGFSIYAIGYANDEMGNNKLLATVNGTLAPSFDIITGTATSGDTSNWAMKLSPVAGTFAPTLENGYGNYSAVPATNTKVVTFPSTTDEYQGASFTATYAAYINQMQPAGTYNGKVKFTMVHPASEVPLQPVTTPAGKIGYVPNATGVTDTMGDQAYTGYTSTVDNFTTPITPGGEAVLWASNFQRPGYGFVGWSDTYDYVANTGSPTNPNAKIYGPNETIIAPSDLDINGLTLYAVWVKSAGDLQDWQGCNLLSQGQVTALTDTRDNNTYAVAKLADEQCWMIENLRLGGSQPINLTKTDSTLSADLTLPASAETFTGSVNNKIEMNATNTLNPTTNMITLNERTAVYSYGNYYSWAAAIGTTITYSYAFPTTSICPKGWYLPRNTISSNVFQRAPGSFYYLSFKLGDDEGSAGPMAFRRFPNNFLYSGFLSTWNLGGRGIYGEYWMADSQDSGNARELDLRRSYVNPGTTSYSSGENKKDGYAIRCLAN